MLIIILVLLLLSLWLFYYTDGHHKQLLREGFPIEATITDPIQLGMPGMGVSIGNSLTKPEFGVAATNTNTTTLSDSTKRRKLDIDPMVLAKHNASNIASLSTQVKTLTDVNVRVRQAAADVKALNGRFNDLAPLRQQSLKNAADLSSLTKDVTPLIGLKQKLADLMVKANLNSTALLNLGKTIGQFQAQSIKSPDDLNKTLGT
jgi:hypothetical protein